MLVRRASDDDSLELAPSPFWDEVVRVLGDGAPGRRARRPPHALDGHDERERLQAHRGARAQRRAGGAGAGARAGRARRARIERALAAWARPTRLRDPRCSGAWRRRRRTP